MRLTEDQLSQLKGYIHSRGFKDDVVVNEILDHFACIVEEILQAESRISLNEAMQKAHAQFGVKGFYPIQQYVEQGYYQKYRAAYLQKVKSLLTPSNCLLFASMFAGIYLVNEQLGKYEVFSINATRLLFYAGLYTLLVIFIAFNIKYSTKRNYMLKIARAATIWMMPFIIPTILPDSFSAPKNANTHYLFSIFSALYFTVYTILTISLRSLLKDSVQDYNEYRKISDN